RIHSYVDTQITRLGGPNFHEIPINSPLAPVHNNQRDGMHRQAIPRGRVSYEPNSLAGGCPFQAGAQQGFMSVPARIQAKEEQGKVRAKPEKFADHYTQATLFFESQSPVEQAHIAAAFRFELSKVTVPAIRERMVASLRNASEALAQQVAQGLGMAVLPDAMPRALENPAMPEVTKSPALSLLARPGDGSIKARKIAILVADGVNGQSVIDVHAALFAEGAVPRFVAPRIGPVKTADGVAIDADASLENEPGFLFDALVLPDGEGVADALSADGHTMEFIRDQHRHCKAILVMPGSQALMEAAGIDGTLPSGDADPGILMGSDVDAFIAAMGKHRHFARETDPPMV
ncbi:MAG: catalase, partial [Rubrivivax sp.]